MRNDNEEVMAWLESSLEYARDRHQARLTRLLESVRTEVVWEAELAKRRGRSTGHSPGALGSPHAARNPPAAARPECQHTHDGAWLTDGKASVKGT